MSSGEQPRHSLFGHLEGSVYQQIGKPDLTTAREVLSFLSLVGRHDPRCKHQLKGDPITERLCFLSDMGPAFDPEKIEEGLNWGKICEIAIKRANNPERSIISLMAYILPDGDYDEDSKGYTDIYQFDTYARFEPETKEWVRHKLGPAYAEAKASIRAADVDVELELDQRIQLKMAFNHPDYQSEPHTAELVSYLTRYSDRTRKSMWAITESLDEAAVFTNAEFVQHGRSDIQMGGSILPIIATTYSPATLGNGSCPISSDTDDSRPNSPATSEG